MWLAKYHPNNWQAFVGNSTPLSKCKAWLKNYASGTQPCDRVLLISGPEGCGKTTAAKLILTQAGYRPRCFTLQEIRNHKKDHELLDNFCQLYKSDTGFLGGKSAIIIDDFESLTKADKSFHATLVDLVKKGSRHSPPIILTITTLAGVSDKKRTQAYHGIAKLALDIQFNALRQSDIELLITRIAAAEKIMMESKVALLVADYAYGDARKAIQTFELIAMGVVAGKLTDDRALDWVNQNTGDNDDKMVYADCTGANQKRSAGPASDEDRVIQVALS